MGRLLYNKSLANRPNILTVICDDLALGDLACFGNPHTRTPNLDALFERGRRYTGYRSGPLCTPARASLMTGRHHLRTGAIDTYLGRSTLRTDETTLPEILRDAGYATGLFGKWHLGDCHPSRPQDRGFDHVLWHRGGGIGQPGDVPGNRYLDPVLDLNGELVRHEGYCTDVFADAAGDWIREQKDGPWFAYVAPNCPHTPLEVPDDWADRYRAAGLNESMSRVYAMVENIDAAVGRLVSTIRELELENDTLVLFTSDHGQCGSSWMDGEPRFNAGLRGIKSTVYEGGVRVPCMAQWPAGLTAGEDERVCGPMDWLPTFARLAGASTERLALDGADLFKPADADRSLVLQWHRGERPVRYRNYAVVQGGFKLTRPHEDKADELYVLPDETHEVSGDHPDLTERLRGAYETFFDEVDPARHPSLFEPVPASLGHPSQTRVELTWQDWRPYEEGREGWSHDNPGWWAVDVCDGGPFQIDITHPEFVRERATLHLACGDWSFTRRIPSRLGCQTIRNVTLPLGPARFEAFIDCDGERVGVTRVVIESRAPRAR
ncbi:MAG: arylsulfatase [Planctomycetota bacterium]